MLAPLGWEAAEIHIKAASEHTINDIRFDMELQIFHKPRPEKEEKEEKKDGENGEGGDSDGNRRLLKGKRNLRE